MFSEVFFKMFVNLRIIWLRGNYSQGTLQYCSWQFIQIASAEGIMGDFHAGFSGRQLHKELYPK